MEWLSGVYAIIGVLVGWVLNEISKIWRSRSQQINERKRVARLLLGDLRVLEENLRDGQNNLGMTGTNVTMEFPVDRMTALDTECVGHILRLRHSMNQNDERTLMRIHIDRCIACLTNELQNRGNNYHAQ